ncbi:MAG: YicC family protein, partial [Desulfobacterales bacterium]|nr:YicC family protein [Desulfobacterales bacterium]
MIHSMTAYARSEIVTEAVTVNMEVRSVNSRHLDMHVRLPARFLGLEERIRSTLAKRLARGRIDIRVQIEDKDEKSLAFEIDEARAAAYHKALDRIRQTFRIDTPISLKALVDAGGIIKPVDIEPDPSACLPVVDECLTTAIDALIAMRNTEGEFLERDFSARLAFIEKRVRTIEAASADLPAHYQQRLQERITALTKGIVELDPARIAQEAAILADRSDISEELVRVHSHIAQFRSLMNATEPAGRKLNFLIQEFNREFNTMGSKTGKAEVAHMVVEVKAELEKL